MEKAQTLFQWPKIPPKKDIKKQLMDALSRINYDNDSTISSDTYGGPFPTDLDFLA